MAMNLFSNLFISSFFNWEVVVFQTCHFISYLPEKRDFQEEPALLSDSCSLDLLNVLQFLSFLSYKVNYRK